MKNFSNKYIFIYSILLVAVSAVLLSVVAVGLKQRQNTNKDNEQMQKLLASININVDRNDAATNYKQYFKEELTVNTNGEIISQYDVAADKMLIGEVRAFRTNLKNEQAKGDKGAFPVYIFEKDGKRGYVLSVRGAGLWGAIWGNVALADDFNTVVGANFDHEGETPGLGAEISTPKFQDQFVGKKILDENGKVVSIRVKKHADMALLHEVDAISGGTMTSNGMDDMLYTDLPRYQKFIDSHRKATVADTVTVETLADANVESNNQEEVKQ